MPYQVVNDPPLQVVKKRYAKLPAGYGYKSTLIHMLGKHHNTHSFESQFDGTSELTLHDASTYDSFAISIHMLLVSFNIDVKKGHKDYLYLQDWQNGNLRIVKSQGFAISIGDLFKLFYKQNPSFFERKKSTKKRGDAEDDKTDDGVRRAEREEEEYDRQQIIKLTNKALKLNSVTSPDPQNVLGALMMQAKDHLRLWSLLIKDGHMKNRGNDFTSFCNALVVLPMYRYDARTVLEDLIAGLASYELIRKIVRCYLFSEDPEVNFFPARDFFNQPKTIADICELYKDQHQEFAHLRKVLTRGLNTSSKAMLHDARYAEPVYFNMISAVEDTYPVYALRNVYLNSWCTLEDMNALRDLLSTAVLIARSDKCKHMVKKRGKFGTYADYETFHGDHYYDWAVKDRKHKYETIRDASA